MIRLTSGSRGKGTGVGSLRASSVSGAAVTSTSFSRCGSMLRVVPLFPESFRASGVASWLISGTTLSTLEKPSAVANPTATIATSSR